MSREVRTIHYQLPHKAAEGRSLLTTATTVQYVQFREPTHLTGLLISYFFTQPSFLLQFLPVTFYVLSTVMKIKHVKASVM